MLSKIRGKISPMLVLNTIVAAFTVYLIVYFITSEDGLIDLLSTPNSFNVLWLIIAIVVYNFNVVIDAVVTLMFLRTHFKHYRFLDALKVAFVGIFFSAITPSSTGGQPMQLYVLSKQKIGVGFGSACMTQKFIIYQILSTVYSIVSIFLRYEYFESVFKEFWSAAFVVMGLIFQISVTLMFLVVSFNRKLTHKLLNLLDKIMHKFKPIKNPDKKIASIRQEVELFHDNSKTLFSNKKLMITSYILVFIQLFCIMLVSYFIYLSFDMPSIAAENGQHVGNIIDFVCIQSFVVFTSNLIPLPGASGGAELAFTMYFSQFFIIGSINKIKPAILLWRFATYYGSLIISAPFSYLTKGKKAEDRRKQLEEIANSKE